MDKKSLQKSFNSAKKKTQFVPAEPGWRIRLGPNDFAGVVIHGRVKKQPVVLTVGGLELKSRVVDQQRYARRARRIAGSLAVPKILKANATGHGFYALYASSDQRQAFIDSMSQATPSQMQKTAQLYWQTHKVFKSYPSVTTSSADYFISRLALWLQSARLSKTPIDDDLLNKVTQFIFAHTAMMKMEWFFSRFQNSDLEVLDDVATIWHVDVAQRPQYFGIASWLWQASETVYDQNPRKWLATVKKWIEAFKAAAPRSLQKGLEQSVRVHLAERLLGSLLVDIPLRRSPFTNLSFQECKKARAFIEKLLRVIVSA